jgi:tetratricopeptide (TPR) repeat protein
MEYQFEHIEKYLRGELPEREHKSFKETIEKDASIREKVENHRILIRGIELGFNQELKQLLQQKELENQQLIKKKFAGSRWLYVTIAIAASISLILTTFFVFMDKPVNSEQIVAAYYQPYPNVESPVNRSDQNKQHAYALYEQGNYALALDQFNQLFITDPSNPAPVFYAGICLLEMKQAASALSKFEDIESLDENKYSRPAHWYKALTNLALKKNEAAVVIFIDLSSGDDIYAKKSAEILEMLN